MYNIGNLPCKSLHTCFLNETENVLSVMGALRLQRTSVTVVKLRAQPPEGVVIMPAGLLSFKEHGLWKHHAL